MFRKESKPQNRIDSLIGATTRIEGNVIFSGGLRVDGMVRGNVAALPDQPGTLVVSHLFVQCWGRKAGPGHRTS